MNRVTVFSVLCTEGKPAAAFRDKMATASLGLR